MGIAADLSAEALGASMPGRAIRSYPAVLSTEADALGWARSGAAHGSVVVAEYQASPRGRAGLPWEVPAATGLAFSVVLRPELPAEREGWIYATALAGLAELAGGPARIRWPDEVDGRDGRFAAVGAVVELDHAGVAWAVLNVLIEHAAPHRADTLARAVEAIEQRLREDPETVLADYRARCATFGRAVVARMIPMGPAGPRVEGTAADVLSDGALVVTTEQQNRVAVRPQNLGMLDMPDCSD